MSSYPYPALRLSMAHLSEALARGIRLSIDARELSLDSGRLTAALFWLDDEDRDEDAYADLAFRVEDAYATIQRLCDEAEKPLPCPANGPSCSGCPDCSDKFGTPDAPIWPADRAAPGPDRDPITGQEYGGLA